MVFDHTLNGVMQDNDYNDDIVLDEHEIKRDLMVIRANKTRGPDGFKAHSLTFFVTNFLLSMIIYLIGFL